MIRYMRLCTPRYAISHIYLIYVLWQLLLSDVSWKMVDGNELMTDDVYLLYMTDE